MKALFPIHWIDEDVPWSAHWKSPALVANLRRVFCARVFGRRHRKTFINDVWAKASEGIVAARRVGELKLQRLLTERCVNSYLSRTWSSLLPRGGLLQLDLSMVFPPGCCMFLAGAQEAPPTVAS